MLFCHMAHMFLLGYVIKSLSAHTERSTEETAASRQVPELQTWRTL